MQLAKLLFNRQKMATHSRAQTYIFIPH